MKEYIITEHNEEIGGLFSFIVKLSASDANSIEKRFDQINDNIGYPIVEIDEMYYTKEDIDRINKNNSDNYMPRYQYAELDKEYFKKLNINLNNFEYEDFPYKGSGLKMM